MDRTFLSKAALISGIVYSLVLIAIFSNILDSINGWFVSDDWYSMQFYVLIFNIALCTGLFVYINKVHFTSFGLICILSIELVYTLSELSDLISDSTLDKIHLMFFPDVFPYVIPIVTILLSVFAFKHSEKQFEGEETKDVL